MAKRGLCVITGASAGIGAAIAQEMSAQGYSLLLLARRVERCEQLNLPNTISRNVDVTDLLAITKAVEEAEEKFGPTEVFVNNAGVMLLGQVEEQDPKEWETMVNVNVLGVLNGIRAVLKGMIARKSGTVVNISSIAGRKSFANHAVYCATKFGVHALTETVREEVAKHNVRFVCIAPGVCTSELLEHTTNKAIVDSYKEWKKNMTVLNPEDVAKCVSFACLMPPHACVREIVIGPTAQEP